MAIGNRSTQKAKRHHFIPQFWTARWADEKGFVKRYRRFGPKVDVRSEPPKSVGYFRNLYDLPDGLRQDVSLEEIFFKPLDDKTSKVFEVLASDGAINLDGEQTATLAIFILSLLHRTPESLSATIEASAEQFQSVREELRLKYDELRGESEPTTFEEYERLQPSNAAEQAFYRSFANYMANENLIDFMARMHWRLIRRESRGHPLLLSDDPIARTNGFKKRDGHFAFPVSPDILVAAFHDEGFARETLSRDPRELFAQMNRQAVGSARHFVVSNSERQTKFIENRFGRELRPVFGEQLRNRQKT